MLFSCSQSFWAKKTKLEKTTATYKRYIKIWSCIFFLPFYKKNHTLYKSAILLKELGKMLSSDKNLNSYWWKKLFFCTYHFTSFEGEDTKQRAGRWKAKRYRYCWKKVFKLQKRYISTVTRAKDTTRANVTLRWKLKMY